MEWGNYVWAGLRSLVVITLPPHAATIVIDGVPTQKTPLLVQCPFPNQPFAHACSECPPVVNPFKAGSQRIQLKSNAPGILLGTVRGRGGGGACVRTTSDSVHSKIEVEGKILKQFLRQCAYVRLGCARNFSICVLPRR